MRTWMKWILAMLPWRDAVDSFLDYLEGEAKKTTNTLDDAAIAIVRRVLDGVETN